jgi:pathogenesis-related protein 1
MNFLFLALIAYAFEYPYENKTRYRPTVPDFETETETVVTPYQYSSRNRYRPSISDEASSTPVVTQVSGDFLSSHNQCRSNAGVGDILWDATIANYAKEYATILASTCTFVHSNSQARPNQGENLYWTSARNGNFDSDAVEAWCNEPLSGANHHTQVAWPTSTKLGCASVQGSCGTTIVCRYSPPGNYGSWRF